MARVKNPPNEKAILKKLARVKKSAKWKGHYYKEISNSKKNLPNEKAIIIKKLVIVKKNPPNEKAIIK